MAFVDLKEVGRTDESGRLQGHFPRILGRSTEPISIREGEVKPVTYPPTEPVLLYAFPGEIQRLSLEVSTCRSFAISADYKNFRCIGSHVATPEYATWAVTLFIALVVFGLAAAAVTVVFSHMMQGGRIIGYVAAGLLTVAMVPVFKDSGFVDQWAAQLTAAFAPAVSTVVVAIISSVGIIAFLIWVRGQLPR